MNIQTKIENGQEWFSFTSRGVQYDVTRDDGMFVVWSKRGIRATPPQVLAADEMRNRSKALGMLVDTINANTVAH